MIASGTTQNFVHRFLARVVGETNYAALSFAVDQ